MKIQRDFHPRRGRDRIALAIVVAALGVVPTEAAADVKVPALFGPHMVLQREQKDRVWGWAEPGEEIKVTIADQSKTAKAGEDGSWHVMLDPMKAGGPHTLTIQGKNTLTFDDVLVGEVWICSGQSNMGMNVGGSKDADLEILAAKYPRIRLISVPNRGTQEPQKDFNGKWARCSPETIGDFSAVGYYFGRQLYKTLGVPIGLIDDAWGGSACEAWIRRDLLAADPRYAALLKRWEAIEKEVEHTEKKAESKPAVKKGQRRPPSRAQMLSGNARPANIYNGVLKPTIGYGIRGVIWYQGESNSGRAYQYRELFPLMIKSWRDEWGQGDFPFYWVQLADFMAESKAPQESGWAELREAQTMTMSRLPKTGQAVIIDVGEGKDIHPKNKQDVGMRLARWALARDYGINVAYQSPTFKSMERQGDKVIVTFDHVGHGLRPFDVQEVIGFTVAGSDKKFVEAKAKLVGRDKVEVHAEGVSEPVAVRYAWANNPVCNLYSNEGLPATPFRTDDWPGVTIKNDH